jgi:Primase C terminal 2 (PriCT-2)/Family of unknown function (DUF5906)
MMLAKIDTTANERKPTWPTGPVWEASKAERNWLLWQLARRAEGSKPAKVPVDPATLAPGGASLLAKLTFDEALSAYSALLAKGREGGVGYLPREGSAMVCLDFDRVLDAATGEWTCAEFEEPDWGTYIERSPSGLGLHALVARDPRLVRSYDTGAEPCGVLADASKFFTVTGAREVGEAVVADGALVGFVVNRLGDRLTKAPQARKARPAADGGWFDALKPTEQEDCCAAMLEALPESWATDREQWLRVTMALREYEGLLAIWDEWSGLGGRHYDAVGNRAVWDARDRSGGDLWTIGSLIHEAEALGVDLSGWRSVGMAAKADASDAKGVRLLRRMAAASPTVGEELAEREAEDEAAAVGAASAQRNLTIYAPSVTANNARWIDSAHPSTYEARGMLSNAGVDQYYGRGTAAGLRNVAGMTIGLPIHDARLPHGFNATGVAASGQPTGVVNAFQWREVLPVEDADRGREGLEVWQMMLDRNLPDPVERKWFEQWVAKKVREPWQRQVGVVHVALAQGTGRGAMASFIARLMLRDNVSVIEMSDMIGEGARYNSYLTSALAVVNEMTVEQQAIAHSSRRRMAKAAYELLKSLIDPGEKRMEVNHKYGAKGNVDTFTSFLICTNHADALPVPKGDRRFVILTGNVAQAPSGYYHRAEAAWNDEQALRAVWQHLAEVVDLSDYDTAVAILTEGKSIMMDEALGDVDVQMNDAMAELGEVFGWPVLLTKAMAMHISTWGQGVLDSQNVGRGSAEERGHIVENWYSSNTRVVASNVIRGSMRVYHGGHRVRVRAYFSDEIDALTQSEELKGIPPEGMRERLDRIEVYVKKDEKGRMKARLEELSRRSVQ